jgi:DNA polymerase-3 subunit epsilon
MRVAGIAKETPIDQLRYVAVDTELTSLDRRSNRLLSVGAIAMDGSKIRLNEQFYRVANPGVPLPAPGVRIHGLRPHDIENADSPSAVLNDLRAFVGGAIVVGHFVGIDLKVIEKELGATGQVLGNPAVDTARVHRWILRHGIYTEDLAVRLDNVDLASLAKLYHIEVQQAHHALDDAFLTARLWQKQIHLLLRMNRCSLRHLLRIGGV